MIYIILPNFHTHSKLMQKIQLISKNLKFQDDFKEQVTFIGASGAYPYNYWNGDTNNHFGEICLHKDFVKSALNTLNPIHLNYANLNLNADEDFNDTMNNVILQTHELSYNYISLVDLNLWDYIKTNYPDYKFIFDKNADIINPLTPDIVNKILALDFNFVEIPKHQVHNYEFLKEIHKRNQLILPINSLCPCDTSIYNNCVYTENNYIYNYSQKSQFNNCSKRYNYANPNSILISLEQIKNIYLPMGINHFYLTSIPPKNTLEFIIFFLSYFIKPQSYNKILAFLTEDLYD